MRKIVHYIMLLVLFLPASESTNNSEQCAQEEMKVVCDEDVGTRNPYCDQKMSNFCSPRKDTNKNTVHKKCYNTLKQEEDGSVCGLEFVKDPRCGSIKPQHITPANESLVQLRLYHYYFRVWDHEALVNLTFPNATWRELEIQSSVVSPNAQNICLNFTLHQNISSTLMYDCRLRKKTKDWSNTSSRSLRLTVQTESGYGASYLYRVPDGSLVRGCHRLAATAGHCAVSALWHGGLQGVAGNVP